MSQAVSSCVSTYFTGRVREIFCIAQKEELASSVVPGMSVSACTIRLSANSERHPLACARSIKHPRPSASRARLQMRTPLSDGRKI